MTRSQICLKHSQMNYAEWLRRDNMIVSDLIKVLEKYPKDLPIAYKLYSELCLLNEVDIKVESHCEARPDGWVQRARPDKELVQYLVFPGN